MNPLGERVIYPNVAHAISDWVIAGDWKNQDRLFESLWGQVNFPHRTDLHGDFVVC